MRQMNRKGQTTTEYIFILAVAIVIGMLVWSKIKGPAEKSISDTATKIGTIK
jgi:hypothetical protein